MIVDKHTHLFTGGDMPREHLKATARRWAYARMPFTDPNVIFSKIMEGLLAMGEGWHNNHHAFPKSCPLTYDSRALCLQSPGEPAEMRRPFGKDHHG